MKTKQSSGLKKLVLGIALVCAVNTSQADTLLPNLSDVFLSVWDPTSQSSYTADLGVDIVTFASNYGASNHSWTLDSVFSGWTGTGGIANGNQLTYEIAAYDQQPKPQNTTLDGIINSYNATNGPNWVQGSTNYGTMATELGTIKARVGALNLSNSTELITDTTLPSYFISTFATWNQNEGTAIPLSTQVGGGGANQLFVEYVHTTGSATVTNSQQMVVQNITGYFSLDVVNSTLNWTSTAVAAVPVPAAIWMFLGGLMSLLGLQKRKPNMAI